jgi:hypothetical protein
VSGLLHWAADSKAAQRGRLLRALAGIEEPTPEPTPEPEQRAGTGSFDGGARRDQPKPTETHEETLVKLLRLRGADTGRFF